MITGVRAVGGDSTGYVSQIQLTVDNRMASRRRYLNNWSPWAVYYSSANTTTASDGTLKAASPVARIVKSQNENQRTDVDEVGFTGAAAVRRTPRLKGSKSRGWMLGCMFLSARQARHQKVGNCSRQWIRVEWESWVLLKQSRQKAVG